MAVFKDVHGGTGRGSICGTGRGQFVVQGVANLWYRVGWPICCTGREPIRGMERGPMFPDVCVHTKWTAAHSKPHQCIQKLIL